MTTPRSQLILAHLALWAVALIYGLNYFLARQVFAEVPPLGMVALRSLFGALVFLAVWRWGTRERITRRADWGRLVVCALFGAALNQLFFLLGLSRTVEVNASVLMTTVPLFVFLGAFLLREETLTWRKGLGLVTAGTGAVLLILAGRQVTFGVDTLPGDLMITFNAACYGVYLVLVRPLMVRYHPFTVVAWVFAFGALVNVPIGLPSLLTVPWETVSAGAWWRVAYILVFVTVGTYGLNAWALRRVPASAVGIYVYLQPVIVTVLAFFWAREDLQASKLLFMALVLGGVFAVTYKKRPIFNRD